MENLNPKTVIPFVLLSLALCAVAKASCPTVEGKYTYTCSVKKDPDAIFAQILGVSGNMLVQQSGCDSYQFSNLDDNATQVLQINGPEGPLDGKIRKSNDDLIRFKTIERVSGTKQWVQKVEIEKKHNGFTLDGWERARVLGVFGDEHSKFSCTFKFEQ